MVFSTSLKLARSSTRTSSISGLVTFILGRPSRLASTSSISERFRHRHRESSYLKRRSILQPPQQRTLHSHRTIPDYRLAHSCLWISPSSTNSGKCSSQVECMHKIDAKRCIDRHALLPFHLERLEVRPSSRYPVSGLRPERSLHHTLFMASLPDSTSRGCSPTNHPRRCWPCEVSRVLGCDREGEAASSRNARRQRRR
jgi:hypothetical protein